MYTLHEYSFSMKLYPESAAAQLEFHKIEELLAAYCQSLYAQEKAKDLHIHTHIKFVAAELRQSHEYKQLLLNGLYFPNDYVLNLQKQLKLLSITDAVLQGDDLLQIKKLVESIEKIFRWFGEERKTAYPGLYEAVQHTYYEKAIMVLIDEVVDEQGQIKDSASEELREIRMSLYRKKTELRRTFEKIVSRLNKQGYLAEIEESFMNGRRVVAVFAEQKRTVKGILHGESDSRRTAFIEPEETVKTRKGFSKGYEETNPDLVTKLTQPNLIAAYSQRQCFIKCVS